MSLTRETIRRGAKIIYIVFLARDEKGEVL